MSGADSTRQNISSGGRSPVAGDGRVFGANITNRKRAADRKTPSPPPPQLSAPPHSPIANGVEETNIPASAVPSADGAPPECWPSSKRQRVEPAGQFGAPADAFRTADRACADSFLTPLSAHYLLGCAAGHADTEHAPHPQPTPAPHSGASRALYFAPACAAASAENEEDSPLEDVSPIAHLRRESEEVRAFYGAYAGHPGAPHLPPHAAARRTSHGLIGALSSPPHPRGSPDAPPSEQPPQRGAERMADGTYETPFISRGSMRLLTEAVCSTSKLLSYWEGSAMI